VGNTKSGHLNCPQSVFLLPMICLEMGKEISACFGKGLIEIVPGTDR
jgi:hypothetical protein